MLIGMLSIARGLWCSLAAMLHSTYNACCSSSSSHARSRARPGWALASRQTPGFLSVEPGPFPWSGWHLWDGAWMRACAATWMGQVDDRGMSRRGPVGAARPGPWWRGREQGDRGSQWEGTGSGQGGAGLCSARGKGAVFQVHAPGQSGASGRQRSGFPRIEPWPTCSQHYLAVAPSGIHHAPSTHYHRTRSQSDLVGPWTGGQAPSARDWPAVCAPLACHEPLDAGGPWEFFPLRAPSPFWATHRVDGLPFDDTTSPAFLRKSADSQRRCDQQRWEGGATDGALEPWRMVPWMEP